MRYYVNFNSLEKKIDFLKQHFDKINENIERLEVLKGKVLWEGMASNRFMQNYNIYLNDLSNIRKNIAKYILFFTLYYEGYSTEYKRLKKKYAILFQKEELEWLK